MTRSAPVSPSHPSSASGAGRRGRRRRPAARITRPSDHPTAGLIGELADELSDERGDVPGWVLVTLMTAGLVVTLWAVAGPTLSQVFTDAIAKVTGAI